MNFTHITKPSVKDPTTLDLFASPVIDDLEFLNANIALSQLAGILNGSFESPTQGANQPPVQWDLLNLGNGNSCQIETTAANVEHGAQAFSMTTGGGITGGCDIQTGNFYPIGEQQQLLVSWYMNSTAANILNQVYVHWYDNTETLLSTTTLYNNATTNSLVWQLQQIPATAPAGARFFKLEVVGVNNTNAGTVYWDGFTYTWQVGTHGMLLITNTGAGTWTVPPAITNAVVEIVGGGGGGASQSGILGTGGASGAWQKYLIAGLVPGSTVSYFVGAGGASVVSAAGNDGKASWFGNSGISADYGRGGTQTSAAPVAGTGVQSGSTFGISGEPGLSGADGGNGGRPPWLTSSASDRDRAAPSTKGSLYGGGGGSGFDNGTSGAGAPGCILLTW